MCSADISSAKLVLPAGQTNLTAPTAPASYIALGVGTQNYTCSAAGTYASAGAVAEVFDISCLYGTPLFDQIADKAIQIWKSAPASVTVEKIIEYIPDVSVVLGQHYFVPNAGATSPKWDFTSSGNSDAFVLGAKVGGLTAPTGKQDVDWLQLKNNGGGLADAIYRTDTKEGQPPASCAPGSGPITVKYVSKYWLFGGSVKV
jgi:hypothetical protein